MIQQTWTWFVDTQQIVLAVCLYKLKLTSRSLGKSISVSATHPYSTRKNISMQNFSQKSIGIDCSSTSKTWLAIACGPRGESNWNIWNNGARPLDEFPKPIALYIYTGCDPSSYITLRCRQSKNAYAATPREGFWHFNQFILSVVTTLWEHQSTLRFDGELTELHGCGRIFLMVYMSGAAFRPVYYTPAKEGLSAHFPRAREGEPLLEAYRSNSEPKRTWCCLSLSVPITSGCFWNHHSPIRALSLAHN